MNWNYLLLENQVLERDGWQCQDCGSFEIFKFTILKFRSHLGGDEMPNLITLCAPCHGRRHGR
jgi:5-methylcytosine-specific restriction endonuclease McrA